MSKELKTVDLKNIEILAVGKWKSNSGDVTFKQDDLDEIVSAFDELTGNPELNYEPPAKLGHDDGQKLLQKDGYPAAGWITKLSRAGDKLIADLKDIPGKIAAIIKAGGYKKVSAEVYSDYEIGGKKYPKVLKAISFLGGDIPAVKTIQDIVAQYASDDPVTAVLYEMAEESLTKKVDAIYQAWNVQHRPALNVDATGYISEVFDTHVIVNKADKYYKVPYSVSESNEFVFDTAEAVRVERVYQEVKKEQEDTLMEKELREVLKLAEDADVIEAVKALKDKANAATPAAGTVSLSEYETVKTDAAKLSEKVTTLETKLAERDRDERVSKALSAGKITPAQKDWANSYAFSDPKGFDAFVAAAPVAVKLGELGSSGETGDAIELTEQEIKLGEKMGLTKEDLMNAKKQEVA